MVVFSEVALQRQIKSLIQVINFSNATSIQAPSKIVDYVLSSRPFITICQEDFDMNEFIAFLNNDFTSFVAPNISQYNEINVAIKFAQLANPDAPKKGGLA